MGTETIKWYEHTSYHITFFYIWIYLTSEIEVYELYRKLIEVAEGVLRYGH